MKISDLSQTLQDMAGDTLDAMSTSSKTASASSVVLNQTELLRFKFIPTLVDNGKEPQKSVAGKLLFEKKRKKEKKKPSSQVT